MAKGAYVGMSKESITYYFWPIGGPKVDVIERLRLPYPHLTSHIFQYLNARDLKACLLTCRSWRSAVEDDRQYYFKWIYARRGVSHPDWRRILPRLSLPRLKEFVVLASRLNLKELDHPLFVALHFKDVSSFVELYHESNDQRPLTRDRKKTLFHVACSRAVTYAMFCDIQDLFQNVPLKKLTDKRGDTPLHAAARAGSLRKFNWLLDFFDVKYLESTCLDYNVKDIYFRKLRRHIHGEKRRIQNECASCMFHLSHT